MNKIIKSISKRTISLFLLLFILSFMIGKMLFLRIDIVGHSMEPTIMDGQTGVALKSYFHHPDTGDIVIIKGDETKERYWVKRVIGKPGETIEIRSGDVYINNQKLNEPYIKDKDFQMGDMQMRTLGENEYFLMGDNRAVSMDSRMVGPIPSDDIIAGYIFVF